jgi:hypothetical protein
MHSLFHNPFTTHSQPSTGGVMVIVSTDRKEKVASDRGSVDTTMLSCFVSLLFRLTLVSSHSCFVSLLFRLTLVSSHSCFVSLLFRSHSCFASLFVSSHSCLVSLLFRHSRFVSLLFRFTVVPSHSCFVSLSRLFRLTTPLFTY